MSEIKLGTLKRVPARKVWKDEAKDFTPWLLENADQLSEALGLDLELHQAEHPVGKFSLDLIGVIAGTQDRVIIENQLEKSDHTHFGQLLTYAGGTDAKYVIWIATEFRDEYLSAIEWLNNGTTEDINFFAVEVGAVQIEDSIAAPLFTVVAQPNEWSKGIKASAQAASTGERGQRQIEFWTEYLETLHSERPGWTRSKVGSPTSWINTSAGVPNVVYAHTVNLKLMKYELVFWDPNRDINAERYDLLLANKAEIEKSFGGPLEWHFPDDNKQAIVRTSAPANFDDSVRWPEYVKWLVANGTKLRDAVQPFLDQLK